MNQLARSTETKATSEVEAQQQTLRIVSAQSPYQGQAHLVAGHIKGWQHVPSTVLDRIVNRNRNIQGKGDFEGRPTSIALHLAPYFATPKDGRPWYWSGKCWKTDEEENTAKRNATELLIAVQSNDHTDKCKELLAAISNSCPELGKPEAGINVGNGFLTLTDGQWSLLPHDPEQNQRYVLGFDHDPESTCPQWQEFLARVQPDPENQRHLQQVFGWVLLGGSRPHVEKFEVWIGEGANGKSVALSVLEALCGTENTSHLPMHDFNGRSVEMLAGKLANLGSEVDRNSRMNSSLFKQAVSGEPITVEPKYRNNYSMVNPAALLFAVNDLPAVDDRSDGIWRRMMILRWEVQIPEAERDTELPKKLKRELPGILNWALQGAVEVMASGQLLATKSIKETTDEMRTYANSAAHFLQECADQSHPDNIISKSDAYAAYVIWCDTGNYKKQTQHNFGKEVSKRVGSKGVKTRSNYRDIKGNALESRQDTYPFCIEAGLIHRKMNDATPYFGRTLAPVVGMKGGE